MERVPQIVAERLKAAAAVGDHPDADVLTAFSERSLSQGERTSVIEHLARCTECRDVVALALPVLEPVEQAVRSPKSGWMTWPVLRWGLIAAGVVAITSFGFLQYRHQDASTMMAYNAPRAEAAKTAEKVATSNSSAPEFSRDQENAQTTSIPAEQNSASANAPVAPSPALSDAESASGAVSEGKPATTIRRPLQRGPRVQWQQNANQQIANNVQQSEATAVAAVPPPVAKQLAGASASRVAPAPSVANAVTTDSVSSNVNTPVLESQSIDQQSAQSGYAESKVEKIKPAVTTLGGPTKVIVSGMEPPSAPAGAPIGRMVSSLGSTIRWTINSGGGLQRSVDQGTTWQDVDVNKSAPPAGAGVSLMKETSRAKAANYDVLDKQDTKDAPIVFRAVAANGPDVWAGASGGLLYHSSDAGAHWTRVIPSVASMSLTGDILTVEFIDPQNGRITTSTTEIWTTSDSGKTWQKQ